MNIAIVNDSAMAVEAIRRAIVSDGRHRVVWTASDGADAIGQCEVQPPDLILMDMLMPNVSGVEATRQIMRNHPCPILVVTASVRANCSEIFQAMGEGALDVVATPHLDDETGCQALLEKISRLEALTSSSVPSPSETKPAPSSGAHGLILIGSSAGGPAALAEILHSLPEDLRAAVLIVQHIDERFGAELAEWLDSHSALPVTGAEEGDRPVDGQVYIATKGEHMVLRTGGVIGYSSEPQEAFYCPSVDRLFESALRNSTKSLIGVLLTGMGRDGAKGLKQLRDAGHFTLAQDEATSTLYGMPKAAAQLHAASEILPLGKIAARLAEKASRFQ